ncbi:MAG: RNA polymerase sigma factor RpoH [Deltaproteobacteria bacterium]|nr:RNA polymerase sigma factor RpoH [Deltaproteobacteria bacterium]
MHALTVPVTTDTLEFYMTQVKQFKLLSREEEYDLAVRYHRHGDLDAAQRLICANLRFVVKIAHEYRRYGLKMLDLIQEGNIGLMMAVKKFEPERGLRLISYAVWWIKAYIHNFIIRSWSMVKIGTTQAQKKLFFKLNQARKALSKMGEESQLANLADELDVREEELLEMEQRINVRDSSIDMPLTEGSSYTLLDALPDTQENQEDRFIKNEQEKVLSKEIQSALSTLNERERNIVESRILSEKPLTLQDLADKYQVSRERIRQLEKNALEKIKGTLSPRVLSC